MTFHAYLFPTQFKLKLTTGFNKYKPIQFSSCMFLLGMLSATTTLTLFQRASSFTFHNPTIQHHHRHCFSFFKQPFHQNHNHKHMNMKELSSISFSLSSSLNPTPSSEGNENDSNESLDPTPPTTLEYNTMNQTEETSNKNKNNNNKNNDNNNNNNQNVNQNEPKLSHCNTICMVPPPKHASKAWEALTKARTQLRDPGLYRWPPHANLLYPFIDVNLQEPLSIHSNSESENENENEINKQENEMEKETTLSMLQKAAEKCEPFQVTLSALGCFGGKNRGVLWVYPNSTHISSDSDSDSENPPFHPSLDTEGMESKSSDQYKEETEQKRQSQPLIQLQSYLQEAIPICNGQTKYAKFVPHITLSHYPNLEEALEAQLAIEEWWDPNLSFLVDQIYCLKRVGDDGQFERIATIPLGKHNEKGTSDGIILHDPPLPFPDMPTVEEDWVRDERMKLKQRRNGKGGSRGRRRKSRRAEKVFDPNHPNGHIHVHVDPRGPSRSTDTPEEIAAKRAARKAKRERLEREKLALSQDILDITKALE